ncbi:MAG: cysteine-rich CWC family protein [Nitrospira sp.]|nr:cysteine-rich CWC family protein [Nitrospira sp.]
MDKSCAKCGQMFECSSPAPQCWCNDVSVDYARWTDHLKQFPGCLCPACLTLFKTGT